MNRLTLKISSILIASITYLVVSCNWVHSSDISVIPSAKLISKFETLSIYIKLKYPFTNPYDPEDIRVDVLIKAPNGDQIELPCFYKTGTSQASQWEARFTAMQTGLHSYSVRVISSQDTLLSKAEQVEVKQSNKDGFLRLDPQSNYSFLFDSGKRFRGVGLNLGWELEPKWGDEKRYTYEMFFAELEKNHGNFFRTWMCPWNLPLEWTRVITYKSFVDEYENWDKTFSHSSGLTLVAGKTDFTEDDLHRVTIQSNSREALIYHLKT